VIIGIQFRIVTERKDCSTEQATLDKVEARTVTLLSPASFGFPPNVFSSKRVPVDATEFSETYLIIRLRPGLLAQHNFRLARPE
jgi:hypothetical protein